MTLSACCCFHFSYPPAYINMNASTMSYSCTTCYLIMSFCDDLSDHSTNPCVAGPPVNYAISQLDRFVGSKIRANFFDRERPRPTTSTSRHYLFGNSLLPRLMALQLPGYRYDESSKKYYKLLPFELASARASLSPGHLSNAVQRNKKAKSVGAQPAQAAPARIASRHPFQKFFESRWNAASERRLDYKQ